MAAPALPVGEIAALARENALPEGEQHMRSTLLWIGFPHAIVRERICNEIGITFQDVQQLKEADITSLASSFSKRTPANTRIMFGQRRIRRLKAFIHWTQDFRRTSLPVSVNGLNAMSFCAALDEAAERADIREKQKDTQEQMIAKASPGNLVSEAIRDNILRSPKPLLVHCSICNNINFSKYLPTSCFTIHSASF